MTTFDENENKLNEDNNNLEYKNNKSNKSLRINNNKQNMLTNEDLSIKLDMSKSKSFKSNNTLNNSSVILSKDKNTKVKVNDEKQIVKHGDDIDLNVKHKNKNDFMIEKIELYIENKVNKGIELNQITNEIEKEILNEKQNINKILIQHNNLNLELIQRKNNSKESIKNNINNNQIELEEKIDLISNISENDKDKSISYKENNHKSLEYNKITNNELNTNNKLNTNNIDLDRDHILDNHDIISKMKEHDEYEDAKGSIINKDNSECYNKDNYFRYNNNFLDLLNKDNFVKNASFENIDNKNIYIIVIIFYITYMSYITYII